MDRIAGWYKRTVKVWIVVIAALVTLAMNASSIHIAQELWHHDALRAEFAARASVVAEQGQTVGEKDLDDLVGDLKTLPIGWKLNASGDLERPDHILGWLAWLLGWAITVAAVSLGAPFWFDLLGKVTNLRSSGGRVREVTSPPSGAKGLGG